MSGFGSGSGFGTPPNPPFLGAAPSTLFGGGDGNGNVSGPPPYLFGGGGVVSGGGFSTYSVPAFASQQQPFVGGFPSGGAATPNGFGSGQQQQQHQQPQQMFGNSPNVAAGAVQSSMFEQSSSTGRFDGFPTSASIVGFAPSNNNNYSAYATRSAPSSVFNAGTPHANTHFAPATASSFDGTSAPAYIPHVSASPFGSSQQGAAQSMSFGTSSNVVASSMATPSGPGFPGAATFSSGPFASSSFETHQHPFTASAAMTTPPPFGMSSTDANVDGMTDEAPTSNLQFGQPFSTTFAAGNGAVPYNTISGTGDFVGGAPANSRVQQSDSDGKDQKLAILQAKIAEKKKKVEEKRIRESAASASSALRFDATPFQPSSMALPSHKSAAPPSEASSSQSVSQRNAVRFAESSDAITRSQLPSELLSHTAEAAAANAALRNSGGRSERENLENAVSLVGVCEHMCPDEELLRREREGDIQLLERPVPDGMFHPLSWTLRNTMVKRFRRSAADYKLDVPEWIRPPDVLESVCGYLEEWVMERDRQGPDPRYKNVAAPPPLDVYQFVWDRTRMVRKDFILQNFVGTGGLVDARATRCHERIARWHCMCEHQLSHIADFVVMQSQQNVQELGQTMKTLNQFYDDSMGRALVEVSDDIGRETRADLSGFEHGCAAETVHGQNPVDYDGSPLANDADAVDARLIGKHSVHSPHHGTAEPEMRGLYILLTIDNDGGMEVLKYAARLFQERPEVYQTDPVQLALSIYKAKIDSNYARFFSILRSTSTPYLTACLMFKHVEAMRKLAIRTCSKAYGGKTRDGDVSYDEYPLKRLSALLCFEDDDETRSACRHYNITVVVNGSGREFIYWKRSSFREPKDTDKGTIVPLPPRKMWRTIEKKLNGATRLAVCRGEVSGEGSFLSSAQAQLAIGQTAHPDPRAVSSDQTQARSEALRVWKLKEAEGKEELLRRRQREGEARRSQDDRRRKEFEQHQLAEEENERKRVELELRRVQQQQDRDREEQEQRVEREQQAKRAELELAAAKQHAEILGQQRKLEAERLESIRRDEQLMIQKEAARRRQEDEEHLRQEAERERVQRELETKRRLENEERLRTELLKQQEQERLRREAEALRLQLELKNRVDHARRKLFWRRLLDKTSRLLAAERTKETLSTLKSKKLSPSRLLAPRFAVPVLHDAIAILPERTNRASLRRSLEELLMRPTDDFKLNDIFVKKLRSNFEARNFRSTTNAGKKVTILLKVAIIFPQTRNSQERTICDIVMHWIESHLVLEELTVDINGSLDVRVVFVEGGTQASSLTCDAALFVVPPPWSDHVHARVDDFTALSSFIDDDVPRVVFSLREYFDGEFANDRSQALASSFLCGQYDDVRVIANEDLSNLVALDYTLLECVDCLVDVLVDETPWIIERRSIGRVFFMSFCDVMWQDEELEKWGDLVLHARATVQSVTHEIDATCAGIIRNGAAWPSAEFASSATVGQTIPDYFGYAAHLPFNWANASLRSQIEPAMMHYANLFQGSLSTIVRRLLDLAPPIIRSMCQDLLDNRFVKRCLQTALLWRVEADETKAACRYVYLPDGMLDRVLRQALTAQREQDCTEEQSSMHRSRFFYHDTNADLIDNPFHDTPVSPLDLTAGKRPRVDSTSASSSRILLAAAPDALGTSSQNKRQRVPSVSRQRQVSKGLSQSRHFTKALEILLLGDGTKDLIIGDGRSTLSAALRGAPSLNSSSGA